jgi:hypothetical protein
MPALRVRAFRGTRRSSVYREHRLTQSTFVRIRTAAEDAGLPSLAGLDPGGSVELDKHTARAIADETGRLRTSATLLDLDDDLAAIVRVTGWCARARGSSWLLLEPLGRASQSP